MFRRRLWTTKCPDCGSEVGEQVAFCPKCGRQVKAAPHRSEYVAPAHVPLSHKATRERSLPVIIVLIIALVILLPLLLAMFHYVGIIGLGDTEPEPVTTDLSMSQDPCGYRFTFGSFTSEAEWDDITIVLSEVSSSASWNPTTSALEGSAPSILEFPPMRLGDITVFCNVTDLEGDGVVDNGDFFTIHTGSEWTFSPGVEYTVIIIHKVSGTLSASDSFSG